MSGDNVNKEYRMQDHFRVPADLEVVDYHAVESKETLYGRTIIPLVKLMMRAQGLRTTIVGAQNIPLNGGAVLTMNHTGYWDFILAGITAHVRGRRLIRFMAKKEIFEVPVVGRLMRGMKHISVDREARDGKSAREGLERLQEGALVGLFPEATISRSFELKKFKTGAARMAKEADVPLIPVACWGSQRIWTKDLPPQRGRKHLPIFIFVGEPIDTSGDVEEVTLRLKDATQEVLEKARRAYDEEYGPFPEGEPWIPASMGGGAPTPEEADKLDRKEREERAARKAEKKRKKKS